MNPDDLGVLPSGASQQEVVAELNRQRRMWKKSARSGNPAKRRRAEVSIQVIEHMLRQMGVDPK